MKRLEGKTALITGATSGIGADIAYTMADEGANVIVVGRNADRGERTVEAIREKGASAVFFSCDITNEESILQLKRQVMGDYSQIDILINNAGVFLTAPIEEMREEDFQKTFDTNVKGYFLMMKHFFPFLKKCRGTVVNNASVAGMPSFIDGRGAYVYSASKAAVIQFTKLCAKNYAPYVRVNCVCPGVVDTPIFTNRDFSRFDGKIPMGRVARPEEISKAVLFLVSEESSYITGVVLPVDGGMSL